MRKLSCFLIVFLIVLACKDKDAADADSTYEALFFDYQKMPKRSSLNAKASEIAETWAEFQALNTSFDVLYRAKNNEDLILAIDDLIDKENLMAKGTYPTTFDEFQIKSRQRVVKTYLFKVKAGIVNNGETTEPTIKMIEAYNALRRQLNVIVNSQLDKKLILDEN